MLAAAALASFRKSQAKQLHFLSHPMREGRSEEPAPVRPIHPNASLFVSIREIRVSS